MQMNAAIRSRFHNGGLLLFPAEAVCVGLVPKVASQTIRRLLTSSFFEEPVQFKGVRVSKAVVFHALRARRLARYVRLFEDRDKEWFSCFFVRNPLSRFVSLYEYCRRQGVVRSQMRFEQFAATFKVRRQQSTALEYLALQQADFACLDPTFIGHFEHFAHDMNCLLGLLGKEPVDVMPRLNRRRGPDWQKYYRHNRVADLVRDCYADDFLLWER